MTNIPRLAEPELRVIHELVMEIDETPTLSAALQRVLRVLCEAAGWSAGAAWHVEGDLLQQGAPSTLATSALASRAQRERALALEPDTVAVPVLADRKVVAILAFTTGSDASRMPWISVLTVVAAHLGGWFRRRKAEEERTTSDARFRHLVENIGDAVLMLDPVGRIVLWPPAAERLFGYSASEAIGSLVSILDEVDAPRALLAELALAKRGRAESDAWRVAKGGARIWTHVVTTPMRDFSGVLDGFAQIVRDLTPIKLAADALRQRSMALERSNHDLEAFAAIASHDLQEPLRKIRTFGDRLKRRCADALSEDGLSYLERMDAAAIRMQNLIDDLLTYSRVSMQAQAYKPVLMAEVARLATVDCEAAVEASGGHVEILDLPSVEADASQMRQLLQNLIGNALKFRRKDVPPRVTISGRRVLDDGLERCEISVADNGIGFDEKYLGRVFEMLQRLHTRAEYEGTGMGLAICRRIVERHLGSITARSTPGSGATFTITLPARQRPSPEGNP